MRGGRSKWLGGGSEHNVLCTLSRFALLMCNFFVLRTSSSNSITDQYILEIFQQYAKKMVNLGFPLSRHRFFSGK